MPGGVLVTEPTPVPAVLTFKVKYRAYVVISVSVLLERSGSVVDEVTEAVFVKTPSTGELAKISTVAMLPLANVPRSQETVPATCVQLPWLDVAETNANPAGSGSVTMTSAA